MNLRTITGETRARLEHSVEVRHGRALQKSQQEVQDLKTQLEEEEYILRLEKEGVTLRAKNQRMKDKESLKEAEVRQDRLKELVAAAEMCSVNLGRKLRVQKAKAEMVNARCEAIGSLAEQEGHTANKAKDELRHKNRELNTQLVHFKLQMDGVGARAAKAEKQLSALQSKHKALNVNHESIKKKLREVRKTNLELVDACAKGRQEVAVAVARGQQMEAYQREAGKAAVKLESAKNELREFQSRVCTLTEVRP
jgi:archaellum component FlaC